MYVTVACGGPAIEPELVDRVFGPSREVLEAPVDPDARFMRLAVARLLAIAMGGDVTYRHDGEIGVFEATLSSVTRD